MNEQEMIQIIETVRSLHTPDEPTPEPFKVKVVRSDEGYEGQIFTVRQYRGTPDRWDIMVGWYGKTFIGFWSAWSELGRCRSQRPGCEASSSWWRRRWCAGWGR